MFTIYIAKATANFGLPATRPIYERALEGWLLPTFYGIEFSSDIIPVLPDRQTAEICLRFATLERKLGEIDRARSIYAHASQFCDPRVNPHFWSEWNSFEIETGSEDTFREMLRIKRSVQAQFNTEASYLAAQAITARQGTQKAAQIDDAQDAMSGAEKQVYGGTNGPAFVAAKTIGNAPAAGEGNNMPPPTTNIDEIQISDDEE
jgi:pre-mRNA-splicing factor SYF1